jgi:protein ImuB
MASASAEGEAAPLVAVVDSLSNRLGTERLWRVTPQASHVPERAVERLSPIVRKAPAWANDPSEPRPIRLLRRPEPIEATAPIPDDPPVLFRWRGALHRVRAAAGPERIADEWWRRTPDGTVAETDRVRDYYRIEDAEGARFWIFRAGLHGGGRTPRWFLHGVFA